MAHGWSRRRRTLTLLVVAAAMSGALVAMLPRQAAHSVALAPRPHSTMSRLIPLPALGLPQPLPLTYGGGQVEVTPKTYMVFWGWANPADPVATLMRSFVGAIGGTSWAAIDNQYYETDNGQQLHVTNPANQLAGVWFDNTNPINNNLSTNDIANEALRGIQHFGITDLHDSNVVVAQPQNANDAGFNSGQYCAWHDISSNGYALPVGTPPFAFTSMPYVLNQGAACGQDFVNTAPGGDLDGFTIVLGHEIEEAVTDPGGGIPSDTGWMDFNTSENGDKCSWVSIGPGGVTNITGNDGRLYAAQGLWDNSQLFGLGYCSN